MRNCTGLQEAAEIFFYEPEEFQYNFFKTKTQNPETQIINKDLKNHMSSDSKTFYNCIVEFPADAADIFANASNQEKICAILMRYFRIKKGWKKCRVLNAMKEIKECLHECNL